MTTTATQEATTVNAQTTTSEPVIGRTAKGGGGKIHRISGYRPNCSQRMVYRSTATPAQMTPANCCEKCWDITETHRTLAEQGQHLLTVTAEREAQA